jgi:hypothetical protein
VLACAGWRIRSRRLNPRRRGRLLLGLAL